MSPRRGLLAIETLLYIFFRLLAPAIASDTNHDGSFPAAFVGKAPSWQHGLRKGLAPLFWDSTLPSAFFLILSGRVVSLTFLERRNSVSLAGAVFRRPVRLVVPVLVALAFTSIVSVAGGFNRASRFAELTSNPLAQPPHIWTSTLEYVNSAFDLFFNVNSLKTDRGAAFLPPSGLAWVIPIAFQQSFTAYTFSILMPYTTLSAKLWAFAGFITVSYWLGSWAWYTLTGLQLAEMTTCYLSLLPTAGLPLDRHGKRHMPAWLVPGLFLALGITLKYLWASMPSRRDDEYNFHARMADGSLNRGLNPSTTPYPRVDDYLVATGAMVLLELSPMTQRVFSNAVFKFFGRISFALYLVSGTVCLSLGSFLYLHLVEQKGWTDLSHVSAVLFFACTPVCILAAAIGHFAVEAPAMAGARWLFDYMRRE